jgi:myo-inositol-1(or 4)-monophosphatase
MAIISPTLSVMIKAAEKASKTLLRDFGEVEQLQVSAKGPGDFVSAADRRAEEIIHAELSRARPDFGFVMEESGQVGNKDAESRWLVDPLDGTTNFLHGVPHWAISIALETKGEVVAGVVYDPVKDEMFTAEKNGGAFMRRKRLRVSGRGDTLMGLMATGAPRRASNNKDQFLREYDALLIAGMSLRRFGAAALDLTYVAAGRCEGFWERDLKIWDVAAGLLIVKEAGGFVCDLDNDKNNPVHTGNVLAANDKLFAPLKKVLRSVQTHFTS